MRSFGGGVVCLAGCLVSVRVCRETRHSRRCCVQTHSTIQTPHFKQFCNELWISIFPLEQQHVCASVFSGSGLSIEDVIYLNSLPRRNSGHCHFCEYSERRNMTSRVDALIVAAARPLHCLSFVRRVILWCVVWLLDTEVLCVCCVLYFVYFVSTANVSKFNVCGK